MATITAAPAVAEGQILGADRQGAIKDSYVVEFKDGAVQAQSVQSLASSLASKHGATVKHTYQHALHGFSATMSAAEARELAADPSVARIEQDAAYTATDAQFSPPSWGLDRVDQRLRPLLNSYTYPNKAAQVRAYVIDTGIRTSHQEFGGRAVWGANFADSINADCNGHGTHVAGTIGGSTFGVAKGVALTAVKVLNCDGGGTLEGIVAGIDWVTGDHVSGALAVANMSLGGPGSAVMDDAVRRSIADGIVYALASGNSRADACGTSPARTSEAITVNATRRDDSRDDSYSNFGPCTDIFAPGTEITSAYPFDDNGNGTDVGSAVGSGTSMATPHVAGAAALMLAANPTWTPPVIAEALYRESTLGQVANAGAGTPNRLLFVAYPNPPAATPGPDRLVRNEIMRAGESRVPANRQYHMDMQSDGNFVLYNTANQPLWHTHTDGNPNSRAVLQSDGNFVIYSASNVALYHISTHGTGGTVFRVQDDGNVVLYGPSNEVYWYRFL